MTDALILDAVRTPRGKGRRGALNGVEPVRLAAGVLGALAERAGLDTAVVDDVVLGCVTPVGEQGADIARSAVLAAGWDTSVAGLQVHRFCASGLEAVNLAAMKVGSGFEDIVVAGGVESMSRVPMGSDGGAWMGGPDSEGGRGFVPQGVAADLLATLEGFSREELDAVAVRSHERAAAAWKERRFARSVVAVLDRGGALLLDRDEAVRPGTTLAGLAALEPCFGGLGYDPVAVERYPQVGRVEHVHTAGNSSAIVDGAAALLLASPQGAARVGLPARARILATAVVGSEPTIMLTGPGPAARKALDRAGLRAGDIDLFELNEAFAAVVPRFCRDLGLDADAAERTVNVNGGAIAMGHPLGATGAMLLGTLLDELERRDLHLGLAALCAGGGMGIATIIERL